MNRRNIPPYTLLLADDSVTTQRVLELTFAAHGVRIVGVADGEQALERARTEPPDIVLADIGLAKISGYDLAARFRQEPSLAAVPVLLLTGAFDHVDDQRVRQSGAAGTLVKPLESGFVIKRVKELLGIAGAGPAGNAPARMVTAVEPPPPRPPSAPRGFGPPPPRPEAGHDRPLPPPRDAHIPIPPAAWDQLREESGLEPDTAHVEGQNDDYFDRLDAAFDTLDAQLAGRPSRTPRPSPIAAVAPPPVDPSPLVPPEGAAPPAPPDVAAAAERAAPEEPPDDTDRDWFAHAVTAESPSGALPPQAAPPAPPAPPQFDRVTMVPEASRVADAFESLLAEEQGETPRPQTPVIEISDEVIDRIAGRVAERLTEGMLIDTVSQIVGAVTERLVKEEIARIRAAAQARKTPQ